MVSFGSIATYISPMLTQAQSMSGDFVGIGRGFLAAAVLLEFFNLVLNYWMRGGAQEAIGKFVRLLVVTSIPFAMLVPGNGWSTTTGYLTNFFQHDAAAAIGVGGSGASAISDGINQLDSAYAQVVATTFGAGNSSASTQAPASNPSAPGSTTVCLDASGLTIPLSASGTCPSGSSPTTTGPSAGASTSGSGLLSDVGSFVTTISNLGSTVVGLLEGVVVMLILGACFLFLAAAMLFALYGPLLLMMLGLIAGPLLVAWLPFEPLNSFATKWLSYMVTMGLAFVIGLIMAQIASSVLNQYAQTIAASAGSVAGMWESFANGLLPAVVAMIFIGIMLLKVEHIAAGLVGGPSIGGGGALAGFAASRLLGATRASRGAKPASGKATQGEGAGASGAQSAGQMAPAGQQGGAGAASGPAGSPQAALSAQAGGAQAATGGGEQVAGSAAQVGGSGGKIASFGKGVGRAIDSAMTSQSGAAKALRYGAVAASVMTGPVGVGATVAAVAGYRAGKGGFKAASSLKSKFTDGGGGSAAGMTSRPASAQQVATSGTPGTSNSTGGSASSSEMNRLREKIQARKATNGA